MLFPLYYIHIWCLEICMRFPLFGFKLLLLLFFFGIFRYYYFVISMLVLMHFCNLSVFYLDFTIDQIHEPTREECVLVCPFIIPAKWKDKWFINIRNSKAFKGWKSFAFNGQSEDFPFKIVFSQITAVIWNW